MLWLVRSFCSSMNLPTYTRQRREDWLRRFGNLAFPAAAFVHIFCHIFFLLVRIRSRIAGPFLSSIFRKMKLSVRETGEMGFLVPAELVFQEELVEIS